MSCENNSNHDQANYCAECSTCHDCLSDSLQAIEAENAKLKEALAHKAECLDYVEKDINKIKADALREYAGHWLNHRFGALLQEYANKVENGQ